MPQVADYVLHRLTEWGMYRVFAYPGDGVNGFLGAYDRANGDPEFKAEFLHHHCRSWKRWRPRDAYAAAALAGGAITRPSARR